MSAREQKVCPSLLESFEESARGQGGGGGLPFSAWIRERDGEREREYDCLKFEALKMEQGSEINGINSF